MFLTHPPWPPSPPTELQDRVRIEAAVLAEEAAHCPQHVPALYHFDARMCIIAMQVGVCGSSHVCACESIYSPCCTVLFCYCGRLPACQPRTTLSFEPHKMSPACSAGQLSLVPPSIHLPTCPAAGQLSAVWSMHLVPLLQYLPPPHGIVRKGLIEGRTYPLLATHLASFLADTLFHTSLLAMPSDKFRCAGGRQLACVSGWLHQLAA